VACAVVLLLVLILTSKVFSPQFLLWLLPLLPLLDVEGGLPWSAWVCFLLVCIATTVIWPFRFRLDIVGAVVPAADAVLCSGPTRLGVVLLALRNTLVGALAVFVLAGLNVHLGTGDIPTER
jgi:hypothetical protein